jgi:hypothetical protein
LNTNFQLQSFAFAPALNKTGQTVKTETAPSTVQPEAKPSTSSPRETFVPSGGLKTPRAGSDMAQMLEDLQANGVLPEPQSESPASQAGEGSPRRLREPTSDYMQMMVDSVQNEGALGSDFVQLSVNNNGVITLLDDSHFSPPSEGTAQHPHGHDHGFKGDLLMGGHLGTEVIEKIGHAAHHGAGHAAAEVSHHAAAHGAGQAVGHAAAKKASLMSEVVAHSAKSGSEASQASVAGLHLGKEAAHHMSTAMEAALQVGTVGAGLLAVPLTINGVKELSAGIKENDTEKKLEGVGGIAVGLRSGATATVMGGMLTGAETLTTVAGVASAGLGVVHAGVDTVLGIRDLKHGKTTEGLIKLGTGVAVAAAAIAGGLPLTLTTVAMLGVKVGHKIYKGKQEKKAAELAAQQKSTPPPVPAEQLAAPQLPTQEKPSS